MNPCIRSFWLAIVCGLTAMMGLGNPSTVVAQTQTYPCETVIQYGTGTSTNGAKLRPGGLDPFFQGTDATFPNPPNAYVIAIPPETWIANSASADSQWIGPSSSTADDIAGTSVYRLLIVAPCAGATLTGRYAASDRGAIRLNGAPVTFPTPPTGWTTWTAFSFNNLLSGLNRLEFYVTNSVPAAGGRPGATGLRAEAIVKATCCPCIELNCPSDIYLTTCSNGAPANFNITGTNRCFTNLTINCSLASSTGIPITSGYVFPVGTHTVLCTASDTAGHRTNCTFRVTVTRDTQAPQIRCPQDIIYPCSGSGTNVFFNVTATDDADASPVVTCVPPSGSFFPPGTNHVLCEARDSCGQVSRCAFRVILTPNGFTKTLQAGFADNFELNDVEPANPGSCLGSSGYWSAMPFDTYFPGRQFSHSFQGLPDNLSAATLILHMKPRVPSSQDDVLRIGLQNCGGAGVWASTLPVASLSGAGGAWVTNLPTTFTLDLAALPGGVNLLAALNTNHRLEFAVGTETLVDYARLQVTYCGPQTTLSGVPYSSHNTYPIHQGDGGISWQTVNSNTPPVVQLDIGHADGYRLSFEPGSLARRLCTPIAEFAHAGLTMDWSTGNSTMATVRFDEPGTNFNRTRVTLDQPSNVTGKMVEVRHDNELVSRYFFPGPDATGVSVPDGACITRMGFTTHYFFMDFASDQEIDLKAIEVPATQHGGTLLTGQIGPVVMGKSVRLYFNISIPAAALDSIGAKLTWQRGTFGFQTMSLLHSDTWIEAFGPQQLTVSDAILSRAIGVLPDKPYGVCSPAYGPWTINLNGVADFCPGFPECNDGHVDLNLVEEINFGGLRLTAGDLGACTIQNTVANSTANSIIVNRVSGGPLTINGATSLGSESWPSSISGSSGPQAFEAHFPPNTMVFVNGQAYFATSATFTAQPQLLGQFYQVCVETTLLPQMSFTSFQSIDPNKPLECLTLGCPTNILVNCTNARGTLVTFSPTGVTRCGANVVVTCEPPSGSVFPPGDTVVQCSATDSQGNQERCEFLVTVLPTCPLTVTRLDRNRLEFRWLGDVVLESADDLGVRSVWRQVIGSPTSSGAESILVLPIEGTQRYFRTVPLVLSPKP